MLKGSSGHKDVDLDSFAEYIEPASAYKEVTRYSEETNCAGKRY